MVLDLPAQWLRKLRYRLDWCLGSTIADCLNRSTTASLIAQNQFLQQIVDNSPGSIFVKDPEGRFLVANQAAAEVHGTTVKAMIGKREIDFNPNISLEQHEAFLANNRKVMETCQSVQKEQEIIMTASGESRWYQTSISPIYDQQGKVLGIVGNTIDVTALKQMQDSLQQLASIDGLTQVANRRRFDEYLQQECLRAIREKQSLSLILFDIDYFKRYNDRYGHQQGDRCLVQVTQAVSQVLKRPTDLIARYGGEEFAVVLPHTPSQGAIAVAQQIQQAVHRLNLLHDQSDVSDRITISMGVVGVQFLYPATPEKLIQAADRALYTAKQKGRDRMVVDHLFEP